MDNKKATEDLKLVKQVLDKHNVPFFLAYGTCLGAYRDKDFLPGDDDIDLGIVEKVDLKTRKSIGWALYDLGFEPQQITFNVFGRMEVSEIGYNGNEKTGIIVCERDVKFTIFFFYEEDCPEHGKEMVCIPKLGAVKLIASPSRFYEKLKKIKFKKETFLIPNPPEEYLEWTYEEWQNPLKRDHGKLYKEIHSEEMMKDVMKDNEVVIYGKDIPGSS